MKPFFYCMFLSLFTLYWNNTQAQNENALVRKGNKQYENNNFVEAEVNYKKSLEKKPNKPEAIYNLGNTLVQQERYTDAIRQYEISSNILKDKQDVHNASHNLGNAFLKAYKDEKDPQKKYQYLDKAIEAYKKALLNQPYDYASKYNLSYAIKLKNESKPGGGKNNNRKNQKQEQNKNQQKKQQQQQQKQQQQQQQQNGQKQDKNKIDKKEAERILQALQNNEKKVRKKVMLQKQKGVKVKIEKEW